MATIEDPIISLTGLSQYTKDMKAYIKTDGGAKYTFSQEGSLVTVTGTDGTTQYISVSDSAKDKYEEY